MKPRDLLRTAVTTLALAAVAACGARGQTPAPASAPASTPATGTRLLEPPTATLPDGAVIRLELAVTPEERAQGLMFRRSLPSDHGMLFLFERSARWPFWMKDTWIPLDLVFLDGSGTVVQVFEKVQPCTAEPCPQYIPSHGARAVLELAAGTAAGHGVSTGARLEFHRVPDYPLR